MTPLPPVLRAVIWGVLVIVALVIVSLYLRQQQARVFRQPLPEGLSASDFSFQTHNGDILTKKDLKGKVWVADFIFTTCPGPCLTMSGQMKEVQDAFSGNKRVKFVSFSVDPETDTPPVLAEYAERIGANSNQWFFLTGDKTALHQIAKDFLLPVEEKEAPDEEDDGRYLHSPHFVLVNGAGEVQGYYDGTIPEEVDKLKDHIRFVINGGLPFEVSILPPLNALLNSITTVLLITGFAFIKRGKTQAHIACMVTAILCSGLFLASYLTYHSIHGVTVFPRSDWVRTLYLSILLPHTLLAMVILPMIGVTVYFALGGKYERHKRLARWTFPMWLFVSITGVIIYFMLYQWFPA